jgi:hypothetical protein
LLIIRFALRHGHKAKELEAEMVEARTVSYSSEYRKAVARQQLRNNQYMGVKESQSRLKPA